VAGRRAPGGVVFIWTGTIMIDLLAVLAIAHDADADSLVFGAVGTTVVLIGLAVLAIVSSICAWRGVSATARIALTWAQFAAAALLLAVMFGFFGGDGTKASSVTPLLLYCAFAQAAIGISVWRSPRPADNPRKDGDRHAA